MSENKKQVLEYAEEMVRPVIRLLGELGYEDEAGYVHNLIVSIEEDL